MIAGWGFWMDNGEYYERKAICRWLGWSFLSCKLQVILFNVPIWTAWSWFFVPVILWLTSALHQLTLKSFSSLVKLFLRRNAVVGPKLITTTFRKLHAHFSILRITTVFWYGSASTCPPQDDQWQESPYICTAPIKVCTNVIVDIELRLTVESYKSRHL